MTDPSSIAARPLLHEVGVCSARSCGPSCGKGLALLVLLVGLGCAAFLSLALFTNRGHLMVEEPGITMAWKPRLEVRSWGPLGPAKAWLTRDPTLKIQHVPDLARSGLLHARLGNMKKNLVPRAKGSEGAIADGPAKVYSGQARMALNLLKENPYLFHDIIQQQLKVLRDQREEENQQQSLEKISDEDTLLLRTRMNEVRRSERAHVVTELLYLEVCTKFKQLNVPLLPSFKNGGYFQFGVVNDLKGLLATQMSTGESMELVQEHLFRIIGQTWSDLPFNTDTAKMSLCEASQIYTMSCHFGYRLRNADQRFQLEKLTDKFGADSGSNGIIEGDGRNTELESLKNYISLFETEQIQHMLSVTSLEAQAAIELQVIALFGDFRALEDKFANVLSANAASRREARLKLMQVVEDHKVESISITGQDLTRLVLEAVAYGLLLNDATKQVNAIYELTLSKPFQTDPLLPDEDRRPPPFLP